jgi:hypothetical protein
MQDSIGGGENEKQPPMAKNSSPLLPKGVAKNFEHASDLPNALPLPAQNLDLHHVLRTSKRPSVMV